MAQYAQMALDEIESAIKFIQSLLGTLKKLSEHFIQLYSHSAPPTKNRPALLTPPYLGLSSNNTMNSLILARKCGIHYENRISSIGSIHWLNLNTFD